MIITGVDVETTGNDPETALITEIGAIQIEIVEGKIRELSRYNPLVYHEKYPPQTEEIVELTGITDAMLKADGIPPRQAMDGLEPLLLCTDYVFAHNAEFDKMTLVNFGKKCERTIPERTWACTYRDVPWPSKYKCKKLAHLAFDHGMHVDRSKLHRAVGDIELMFELVLPRYPLDEILMRANSPQVFLAVKIPPPWEGRGGDGGVGKAHVGKLGWGWEKPKGMQLPPTFSKKWVKRVREFEVENETEKAKPYEVYRL